MITHIIMIIDNILSIIVIYYHIISFNFYFPSPPGLTGGSRWQGMTSPLVARRHKNCETFLPLVQTIVIFANKLSKVNESQGLGWTYFDDLLLYANYCTMITIRHFDENFKEKESHQKSKLFGGT